MAIPKLYEVEFLRYPDPKNDVAGDVKAGDMALVVDEFIQKPSKKYPEAKGLIGTVLLKDETKRVVRINTTSYRQISSAYGIDTKSWIGKSIVYKGEQPCGRMLGHVWDAVR